MRYGFLTVQELAKITYRTARRVAVAVVGSTVLLIGIFMIVMPGPALIVIPSGLAILSVEYAWARLWLRKLRRSISANNAKNRGDRVEIRRRR